LFKNNKNVSVVYDQLSIYPSQKPYHPSVNYPELRDMFVISPKDNNIFDQIRKSFHVLNLDSENYGTASWNPLGFIIKKNDTVILNPNLVTHKHKLKDDWDYCITHGSVIKAVADYVFIALKGKGRIIIADGPQTDSDIDKILELTGIKSIQEYYDDKFGFKIEFIDFRDEKWTEKDGIITGKEKLQGDPSGSITFDLGNNSFFSEIDNKFPSFYGSHYDISETMSHHSNGKHEYCICKTPIEADVFINIPKLKSHKKCGLTVNLKSLVGGVNANKNYLPHYVIGSPETGGDQFDTSSVKSKLENKIVLKAKKLLLTQNKFVEHFFRKTKKIGYKIFGDTGNVVRSGNWHGNDTVWRMCLDLNRILFYGEPSGILNKFKVKKHFSVVDGINSMEGNGPLAGNLKKAGLIICGINPVAVDAVCAKLMGFDYRKIPLIYKCFEDNEFHLVNFTYDDIECFSNDDRYNKKLRDIKTEDSFRFEPHFGWKGHIEEK
jgi:uncharacterized protein (DUF362 family)